MESRRTDGRSHKRSKSQAETTTSSSQRASTPLSDDDSDLIVDIVGDAPPVRVPRTKGSRTREQPRQAEVAPVSKPDVPSSDESSDSDEEEAAQPVADRARSPEAVAGQMHLDTADPVSDSTSESDDDAAPVHRAQLEKVLKKSVSKVRKLTAEANRLAVKGRTLEAKRLMAEAEDIEDVIKSELL